jgi:hypothetical protein
MFFPIMFDRLHAVCTSVHGKITKCLWRKRRMCAGYFMVIYEVGKVLVLILYLRRNCSLTICVTAVTVYLSCLVWESMYF